MKTPEMAWTYCCSCVFVFMFYLFYSVTAIVGCLCPYKGVPVTSFVLLHQWASLVDFLCKGTLGRWVWMKHKSHVFDAQCAFHFEISWLSLVLVYHNTTSVNEWPKRIKSSIFSWKLCFLNKANEHIENCCVCERTMRRWKTWNIQIQ